LVTLRELGVAFSLGAIVQLALALSRLSLLGYDFHLFSAGRPTKSL
jgi:hypothetical protein